MADKNSEPLSEGSEEKLMLHPLSESVFEYLGLIKTPIVWAVVWASASTGVLSFVVLVFLFEMLSIPVMVFLFGNTLGALIFCSYAVHSRRMALALESMFDQQMNTASELLTLYRELEKEHLELKREHIELLQKHVKELKHSNSLSSEYLALGEKHIELIEERIGYLTNEQKELKIIH